VDAAALHSIHRPSRSTNAEVSSLGSDAAPTWQTRYDTAQLDRMKAILEHYGYPFYGPETLPEG
jgi:hypothetical protein